MLSMEKAIQILNEKNQKDGDENCNVIKNSTVQIAIELYERRKEEIVISVSQEKNPFQKLHFQDLYVFYFAWKGNFKIHSKSNNHQTTILEGQSYMSLPTLDETEVILANSSQDGLLIKIFIERQTFFKEYFSFLASNSTLFQFFGRSSSDDSLLVSFEKEEGARELIELLCREYADFKRESDALLKSLFFSFLVMIERKVKEKEKEKDKQSLIDFLLEDILTNYQTVTLNNLAEKYGYHPAYLSTIIRQKLGKTFSQLILEQRMKNAEILILNSNLTLEEISQVLGYGAPSNFYRSFHSVYGLSPRQFLDQKRRE